MTNETAQRKVVIQVFSLPEGLSLEQAAALPAMFMTAWMALSFLAPPRPDYDVVLDANGVSTLAGSMESLRAAGKRVVYGFGSMLPRPAGRPNYAKLALDLLRTPRFSPLALTNSSKSVLAFNLSYLFDRQDLLRDGMGDIMDLLASGRIQPPGVTPYPFDQVAQAHRDIQSGQTTGKLVLVHEA